MMKTSKLFLLMGLCLPLLFACGDDDNKTNNNETPTPSGEKAALVVGKWCTTHLKGYITDMDGNVLENWDHDAVKGDMAHLNRYKEVEFTTDGRFFFWSQNENGSAELRGRLEKTMVGLKYRIEEREGKTLLIVNDIIEGYQDVQKYEKGEAVVPAIPEMQLEILGLSATSCELYKVMREMDGGTPVMSYETLTFKKM
jgi:hypothetical protein